MVLLYFQAMVELDGDDVRVSSRGKYAERDIVQVRNLMETICLVHGEEPVSSDLKINKLH